MSSTSASPVLALRGIHKTYGTEQNPLPVLRSLDLRVVTGEFVAVVGASGSGKSTLLNIIGCLDRPTSGSYHLVDEDVSTLDDLRLSHVRKTKIGFVFQSFHLVQHLTVEENVELPLFYARLPRRARRERSRAILDRVGLGHRRTHVPSELSGGECQRTAVARALINDPSLILADEPTGNLDSVTSAEIMKLFVELHASGRTILMITHDPGVAAVAQRRILMRDGRIERDEQSGPTAASAPEASCSPN
ncbi:MAG TPA: ABC transporter ATP-binding protein [Planctomycetota bacterium]|nr:ABC transporter ATP-binding protein [Planctomycetota bacterium]